MYDVDWWQAYKNTVIPTFRDVYLHICSNFTTLNTHTYAYRYQRRPEQHNTALNNSTDPQTLLLYFLMPPTIIINNWLATQFFNKFFVFFWFGTSGARATQMNF